MRSIPHENFLPSFWLKNPYLQSILASSKFRIKGLKTDTSFFTTSRKYVITTSQGVRLIGYHSSHKPRTSKGTVIFLHGWEGSSDSVYVVKTAHHVFQENYDVFRLNLRDHGDSHRLNRGLFFVTLFDEVFDAVTQICQMAGENPVFMVGFSLGGNYALRIARLCKDQLSHVFAISPVINPEKSTLLIDNDRIFKFYLLKKWKRSLRIKQSFFPDRYDFSRALKCSTVMAVTQNLLEDYSPYADCRDYFQGYTLLSNALKDIKLSTTIITAEDDPIIPVSDFFDLQLNPHIDLIVHPYGGHNGFFEFNHCKLTTWYERFILNHLQA